MIVSIHFNLKIELYRIPECMAKSLNHIWYIQPPWLAQLPHLSILCKCPFKLLLLHDHEWRSESFLHLSLYRSPSNSIHFLSSVWQCHIGGQGQETLQESNEIINNTTMRRRKNRKINIERSQRVLTKLYFSLTTLQGAAWTWKHLHFPSVGLRSFQVLILILELRLQRRKLTLCQNLHVLLSNW